MKTLLAASFLVALAAGACRKTPKVDAPPQGSAAPQSPRPANPTYGADLIRKAQGAAAAGNDAVHQEEKTDAPAQ